MMMVRLQALLQVLTVTGKFGQTLAILQCASRWGQDPLAAPPKCSKVAIAVPHEHTTETNFQWPST